MRTLPAMIFLAAGWILPVFTDHRIALGLLLLLAAMALLYNNLNNPKPTPAPGIDLCVQRADGNSTPTRSNSSKV